MIECCNCEVTDGATSINITVSALVLMYNTVTIFALINQAWLVLPSLNFQGSFTLPKARKRPVL
jgi:hypothetical protein